MEARTSQYLDLRLVQTMNISTAADIVIVLIGCSSASAVAISITVHVCLSVCLSVCSLVPSIGKTESVAASSCKEVRDVLSNECMNRTSEWGLLDHCD